MKVGFIGLGIMGASMAANLQKAGHELVVNDLRREAATPHLDAGAVWADTPRKVAEAAEVVFTSLPGPPEMEAVALGDEGLLAGMRAGRAYFDLTTNSPTVVRRVHAVFAAKGVHLLDAPVSGGPRGARTGKLAIWVGGDAQVFAAHKPLLDAMGDQAVHVGPIGAGSVAKLVHNCAGYAIQTALAEVFTLGVKAGVEPLALWQAVRKGAVGRQRAFDRLADNFLRGRYDPPSFALRLAHKDVSLATALGREHRVPMRLANLVLEEMTEALNRGWAERDSRVAMLLQEERAGVQVRVDEAALQQALQRDPPVA
jgi:3-hydroxyisobutyrate dehydrogenase